MANKNYPTLPSFRKVKQLIAATGREFWFWYPNRGERNLASAGLSGVITDWHVEHPHAVCIDFVPETAAQDAAFRQICRDQQWDVPKGQTHVLFSVPSAEPSGFAEWAAGHREVTCDPSYQGETSPWEYNEKYDVWFQG